MLNLARRSLLLGIGLRAQGWENLFDGSSTEGWLPVAGGAFPSDCWAVRRLRTGFRMEDCPWRQRRREVPHSKIRLLDPARRRPEVEHWLNGRRVLAYGLEGPVPERSAISLQNHSSECWYRALRIRSL